jgi:hypothetical protein
MTLVVGSENKNPTEVWGVSVFGEQDGAFVVGT